MKPELHLDLQYACEANPQLTEARVHDWTQQAVDAVTAIYREAEYPLPYQQLELTIRFVDEHEVQQLNLQYRQKDSPTNVLTFEYGVDEHATLRGDIIICCSVLEHEAQEQTKPFLHHAAHLTIHGVLHALGYDHIEPDDMEEMEELEIEILHAMDIPNPYITK